MKGAPHALQAKAEPRKAIDIKLLSLHAPIKIIISRAKSRSETPLSNAERP